MRHSRFVSAVALAAVVALAAAACERDPAAPPALSSAGPVVLSVTGSGHATAPLPGEGNPNVEAGWRTFSFTAQLREDGTAEGAVQYDTRTVPGAIQHGRVFCVRAIGNGIYGIAAEATQRIADEPPPAFPGLPPAVVGENHGLVFAVRDNGEGATAAGPDEITGVTHTTRGVAAALCANPAGFGFTPAVVEAFLVDIEAGNIQVR